MQPPQRVASFEDLRELMLNLHDCPFDLDEAAFDEQGGTWSGTFLRPLWGHPDAESRRVGIFSTEYRLPVVKASIRIEGVRGIEVIDDQGIGRYTLNDIARAADYVQFSFNEVMRIVLHLAEGIDARYDEQPLPTVRAVYTEFSIAFLVVQSGPRIEEMAQGDYDSS